MSVQSPPSSVEQPAIALQPIAVHKVIIPIRGVTPVIPHRWSEKSRRLMLEAQQGIKQSRKREAKNPEQEAEDATYYLPDGRPGMPSTAFKAALVDAVRYFEGITLVMAKQMFFVEGDGPEQLVAIAGPRELREDTPRNSGGTADLRYRYAYWPWTADLTVSFIPSQIDVASVVNLVNAGGLGGVGDWRPSSPKSKTGTFGRFEVDPDRGVAEAGA